MFVATFNYALFQRADVLCAAESSNALRPELKDSVERGFKRKGVIPDGDTIKKTKEYNKLRKDATYRQLLYPTTYSWEKAAEFIKSQESNKYVWYLINMYSSSELNKQYVIKSLVSFNENSNVKKILYDSFFSYCFTDPSISTIKRKKPVITHPDILMKKFTIVREMRSKIR